jgi:hypothetical protein
VGLALLLTWSTAALAGSDDGGNAGAAKPADSGGIVWFGGLFGGKQPAKKPEKDNLHQETVAPRPADVVDEAAAIRAREEAALLRRMEISIKLQQIADRTGNDSLRTQAEQLLQRANDVYFQRTATLPSSHASADLDERLLEKHDKLSAGALPSTPLPHTVPGVDARRAATHEEVP